MKLNRNEIEKHFLINDEILSGGRKKTFRITEICEDRIKIKPTHAKTKSRLRFNKLSVIIHNFEKIDCKHIEKSVGQLLKEHNLTDTQNESYMYGMAREYLKRINYVSETKFKNEFEKEVELSEELTDHGRKLRLANAPTKPEEIFVLSKVYKRNPDVVVEVLKRAKGKCERCKCAAPFKKAKDGTPYLEIHHITWLSEGGDDTVENTLALCPNCHRKSHFGSNL